MPRLKKKKKKINPIQLKSSDIANLRTEILEIHQKGVCLICGEVPQRPCLDHSHTKRVKGTGLIRGVLCSSCNIFIAKSENNCSRYGFSQKVLPKILRSMANYLEGVHYPYIHPSEAPPVPKLMRRSYNKLKTVHQNASGYGTFPNFPKSGKMIKQLQKLYDHYDIEPEFYK